MTGEDHYEGVLRQELGDSPGQQICYPLSLERETLIGRDPGSCQIVLDSSHYGGVSRRHALIRPLHSKTEGMPIWQICDLNSANGTFVNGRPVRGCQILQVGDRIVLSQNGPQFVLEYRLVHPAPTTPVVPHTTPPPRASGTDRLTLSQLLPIVSARSDRGLHTYLLPGITTVLFVILFFMTAEHPTVFKGLLAVYLGSAGYYFIYQLCEQPKPWWVLLGTALATVGLLLSPVLNLFIFVFRDLLPGQLEGVQRGFLPQFIHYFFAAGLMEELLKALPVLGLYLLGRRLRSPWRQRLGVWEPLDGILLAAASALGFTWLETLGQYVPGVTQEVAATAGQQAGQLAGLQLLIPRVLGSVAGHMAYSGYFGYFIGLSVLKPSKRWRILAVGWLTSAALHALWNASAGTFGPLGLAFVGVLSYAFLTAAILKARELSPR
uniref:FHA domain containing protein n=1 Tax=Cyanothece sp. (strain PCC 7425 / ATCC 29141) TaxID=395961 RepID=B8HY56_CYAP4